MRNSLTTFNASVSREEDDAACFLVLLDQDRSLPPNFFSQVDVEIQEPERPPAAAANADAPPAAAVKVHAAHALGDGLWRHKR